MKASELSLLNQIQGHCQSIIPRLLEMRKNPKDLKKNKDYYEGAAVAYSHILKMMGAKDWPPFEGKE